MDVLRAYAASGVSPTYSQHFAPCHCAAYCSQKVAECVHHAFQHEIPFAHPLPQFPISKEPRLAPSFADKKEVSICTTVFFTAGQASQTRLTVLLADTSSPYSYFSASLSRQTHVRSAYHRAQEQSSCDHLNFQLGHCWLLKWCHKTQKLTVLLLCIAWTLCSRIQQVCQTCKPETPEYLQVCSDSCICWA